MRFADIMLIGGVAIAALAAVYGHASDEADATRADAKVSLSDLVPCCESDAAQAGRPIRFSVAPLLQPGSTPGGFSALSNYLSGRMGRPFEVLSGRTFAELDARLRVGEVDVALMGSGPYVLARRRTGLVPLAVPVVAGRKTSQAYLIVPVRSSASSWRDLRGARFAFTDALSSSGRMVPAYALAQLGATPEIFFREIVYTHGLSHSIRAVTEGLVDGASVDGLAFERALRADPGLAKGVRVVWRSARFGNGPVVAHPRLAHDDRERLARLLLAMHHNPAGRGVLRRLGFDRFEVPDLAAYRPLEAMLSAAGATP